MNKSSEALHQLINDNIELAEQFLEKMKAFQNDYHNLETEIAYNERLNWEPKEEKILSPTEVTEHLNKLASERKLAFNKLIVAYLNDLKLKALMIDGADFMNNREI